MMSTVSRALLGLSCVAAALVVPAGAAAADRPGSIALAIDRGFADPSFVTEDGTVHAYATGGGRDGAFRYATAGGMDGPWQVAGPSMPTLPDWAGPTPEGSFDAWAPSVFRNGAGRYVMYFTANNRRTDDRCVGVATASHAAGPFTARPAPLLCGRDRVQVIDAAPTRRGDQRFVVYKVRTPVSGGMRFEIRAHKTDASGTALAGAGPRTLIRIRDANIEAPDPITAGGAVFLFVSRGDYRDCTYRTEVWRADRLWTSDWRRVGNLMTTASTGLCGPGGAEVRRLGGVTWLVFHAWKCPDSAPDCRRGAHGDPHRYRAMFTARVGWGAGGRSPHVLDHR